MLRLDVCRHYVGGLDPKCRVGHCVRTLVGGDDYGWLARLPCTRHCKGSLPKDPGPDCSDYSEPSAEEVVEDKARFDAELAAIVSGKCPQCGEPLAQREDPGAVIQFCKTCPDVYSISCKSIGYSHE